MHRTARRITSSSVVRNTSAWPCSAHAGCRASNGSNPSESVTLRLCIFSAHAGKSQLSLRIRSVAWNRFSGTMQLNWRYQWCSLWNTSMGDRTCTREERHQGRDFACNNPSLQREPREALIRPCGRSSSRQCTAQAFDCPHRWRRSNRQRQRGQIPLWCLSVGQRWSWSGLYRPLAPVTNQLTAGGGRQSRWYSGNSDRSRRGSNSNAGPVPTPCCYRRNSAMSRCRRVAGLGQHRWGLHRG